MYCNRQNEMVPNFTNENNIDINNNINMYESNQMMMPEQQMGMVSSPIIEPMRERVINRTIVHEVPHVCPMRTRVINNHAYISSITQLL